MFNPSTAHCSHPDLKLIANCAPVGAEHCCFLGVCLPGQWLSPATVEVRAVGYLGFVWCLLQPHLWFSVLPMLRHSHSVGKMYTVKCIRERPLAPFPLACSLVRGSQVQMAKIKCMKIDKNE